LKVQGTAVPMTDHPIACTLSPEDAPARLALIESILTEALSVRVRLHDTSETERRTRELIAAEEKCCPFLRFDLRREPDALVVDITTR
jgi:hypothetical protein